MVTPITRAGGMVDEGVGEAKEISSRPAAAITMDVAAEAVADAAAVAVEAEPSRARTPTTR